MISYDFDSGMRYLSVCDGIGACHLAWQQLGWECVGVSEIAPFPAAVVDHHWGFRQLGDMTKYREWPERLLADVDLLVGGTPCPSFSSAGKRQGLDDPRGILLLQFADLFNHINEIRRRYGRPPAITVFENVPGILTSKDNAFGHFVGRLLGCPEAPRTQSGKWHKAGFLSSQTVSLGWRVLDAQYFAVAQRRRRVFLVAVPCELVDRFGKGACPSQILLLTESVLGSPPTRGPGPQEAAGTAGGQLAGWIAGGEAGETNCEPREVIAFNCNARGSQLPSQSRDTRIADTLTASQRAAVAFAVDGRNQSIGVEVHHTLRVGRDSGDAVVVGSSEVSGTLRAQASGGFRSDGTPVEAVVIHNCGVRKQIPNEYERLQGFPDDYTLVPFTWGKPAADTPRYKALGNSIAVPVLSWIGKRIVKAFARDGAAGPTPDSMPPIQGNRSELAVGQPKVFEEEKYTTEGMGGYES